MRHILSVCALAACVCLVGCKSDEKATSAAAPGAVSECGADCSQSCCGAETCPMEKKAAPGAMGEKADCGACPMEKKAAPGAMGEKSDCGACPSEKQASPGAMGDGNCSSSSACCPSSKGA